MKELSGAIAVFFLCLFAFTRFVGPIPLSINATNTQKTEVFSVTGTGKVTMIPDIAVVSVGVTSQGQSVSQVQNDLNKKMNAVSAAVKRLGVDGKDIETTNYSISPTYEYSSGSRRATGYQANSNLTIKVRKIDTANSVIDAATANGANEVGGISFDVDDKEKAQQQARELAIADAKKKAEAAAHAAGFRLGRITNYSEGGDNSPRPIMYDSKAIPMAGGGAPTEVQPGSSEVDISVTLSYELP
jgi:uncharacterized protein YggE